MHRPPPAADTPTPLTNVIAVIAAALDAPLPLRLAVRCDLAEVMKLLDEANTIHALAREISGDHADLTDRLRHTVDRAAALARIVAELFRRKGGADAADWLADALALASRIAAEPGGPDTPAWPLHLAGPAFDVRFEGHLLATVADGLHDFTGADLSAVDLDGVPLTGVRWSATTRWPEGWAERVTVRSDVHRPGEFVVGAGSRVKVHT